MTAEDAVTRIAAFDVSLTATGYATSAGASGVISPPKTMRGMERIQWIRAAVLKIVADHDLVVIEGYSYGAQGRAILDLAELGGVLRCSLHDRRIAYVEIPPSSLKLFACGKGNAKKDEMLAAAIRKLTYMGSDHNESDALWLLTMAKSHYWLGEPPLNEAQRRAHEKMQWPLSPRSPFTSTEERA